jgi:creatinine amidohydrolase
MLTKLIYEFEDIRREKRGVYLGKKNAEKKKVHLWLDELSTKEAQAAAKVGVIVILPIGSVEEHGAHLPLCTDSLQSEYVALEVAKKTGCLVAPPFRYGICNAGRNFSGTLSVKFETLFGVVRDVLSELVRHNFSRIIVLTGHSGSSHMTALKTAAQTVIDKGEQVGSNKRVRIMVVPDFDFALEMRDKLGFNEKDGHGGAIETARMMDIRPEIVGEKGEASFPDMPRFEVVAYPERYFPMGIIGDPAEASRTKGRRINDYVIEQVVSLVEELQRV